MHRTETRGIVHLYGCSMALLGYDLVQRVLANSRALVLGGIAVLGADLYAHSVSDNASSRALVHCHSAKRPRHALYQTTGTLAACGVGAPGWAFDAAAYAAACRALEARAVAPPRPAGAPPGAAAGPGA